MAGGDWSAAGSGDGRKLREGSCRSVGVCFAGVTAGFGAKAGGGVGGAPSAGVACGLDVMELRSRHFPHRTVKRRIDPAAELPVERTTLEKLMTHRIWRGVDFENVGPPCIRVREIWMFNRVALDSEVGTLAWRHGGDFDPATLHDWPECKATLRIWRRDGNLFRPEAALLWFSENGSFRGSISLGDEISR